MTFREVLQTERVRKCEGINSILYQYITRFIQRLYSKRTTKKQSAIL